MSPKGGRVKEEQTAADSTKWENQHLEEAVCLPSELAVTQRRQTKVLHDLYSVFVQKFNLEGSGSDTIFRDASLQGFSSSMGMYRL